MKWTYEEKNNEFSFEHTDVHRSVEHSGVVAPIRKQILQSKAPESHLALRPSFGNEQHMFVIEALESHKISLGQKLERNPEEH